MEDLRMLTTSGTDTVLDAATVQGFKTCLRGPLLRPGDAGYAEARTVWNGMIDRKPALIARCAGVADVIQAVNFARTHQLSGSLDHPWRTTSNPCLTPRSSRCSMRRGALGASIT
jgi:FAD/FMN-containing dehydrogenase